MRPLVAKGGWIWGTDGKLRMFRATEPNDSPWIHAPHRIPESEEAGVDCGILTIMHNHVLQRKAAPTFCMECYKVVIVPKSLEHVHKIHEWQQGLGVACKVGAERRPYTQRVWGAYFYCRGVEQGRERYKQVREWVDENLGEDVVVFLKRACTEFEQNLGDSDQWEKIPNQDEIEKEFLGEVLDYEPFSTYQSDVSQHDTWDIWDEWDAANQPPVTYHDKEK